MRKKKADGSTASFPIYYGLHVYIKLTGSSGLDALSAATAENDVEAIRACTIFGLIHRSAIPEGFFYQGSYFILSPYSWRRPSQEVDDAIESLGGRDSLLSIARTILFCSDRITQTPRKLISAPKLSKLVQPTFQEVRNTARAICDGNRVNNWKPIEGEVALRHLVTGQPLQVKFAPSSKWGSELQTRDDLFNELHQLGPDSALLLLFAITWVQIQGHITTTLDELIRCIGWTPRSTHERLEQRRTVWRWLLFFDSALVIGKRTESYKDPATKKLLDLSSTDALIVITGKRAVAANGVPYEVSFTAGPWLNRFSGNARILPSFGNLRNIAAIHPKQPSGSWGRTIGLSLNQLWREQALTATPDIVKRDRIQSDASQRSLRFRPFMRKTLLCEVFPASPAVEELLETEHPKRAMAYWNQAVAILRRRGVIGVYRELGQVGMGRTGWQADWLTQKLDIRPTPTAMEDLLRIRDGAMVRTNRVNPRKP